MHVTPPATSDGTLASTLCRPCFYCPEACVGYSVVMVHRWFCVVG